ncbi:MAG: transposase [Thermoplasmata archaeon]
MDLDPPLASPITLPPLLPDPNRQRRGLLLAARTAAIAPVSPFLFLVRSPSSAARYQVRIAADQWSCTCPDFLGRNRPCKHVFAVEARLRGLPLSPDGSPTPRPSYPQDWPTYNRAQLSELRLVSVLLSDLVADAIDPSPASPRGRPRLPFSDLLFCAVQKVYTQLSLRRAYGHFEMAAERRQIRHAPSFVMPSILFRRADLTPLLLELIARSAQPLARLESVFAADASGYRTTSFGAYCQEAHGPSRTNVWKKAHIIVGTTTHVVAGAVVTEGTGADIVQFGPLLNQVNAAGFSVHEVCADKAYLSRANVEAVSGLGARAYIPLKSSSIGRSYGSASWAELYLLFEEHREEFERHFHQRSNVEAVFAAIKRKLGETLKSRDPTAQIHELLAKLLAYNLTVLIHEMYEHRVVPEFLQRHSVPRELAPEVRVTVD